MTVFFSVVAERDGAACQLLSYSRFDISVCGCCEICFLFPLSGADPITDQSLFGGEGRGGGGGSDAVSIIVSRLARLRRSRVKRARGRPRRGVRQGGAGTGNGCAAGGICRNHAAIEVFDAPIEACNSSEGGRPPPLEREKFLLGPLEVRLLLYCTHKTVTYYRLPC